MNLKSSSLLWSDLCISPNELRLSTLKCGQSFRWKQTNDYWASILNGRLVVLKETPKSILYGYDKELKKEAIRDIRDYFQLDKMCLQEHYDRWSKLDANFSKKSSNFKGIRMLRQNPFENLISFICSSNNNITRITQMIDKFCIKYGQKMAVLDDVDYYEFPTLKNLLKEKHIESDLRQLGFGYRAKYIAKTISMLESEQELYLLRELPYLEAKEALMKYQGVGPKVADCICLMSLDHSESIPVDTHVWQIAKRDYGFHKKGNTLNSQLYLEIGNHFRFLFGEYSGWAHSVLFTADLKDNKRKLVLKEQSSTVVMNKKIKLLE